jgi:hypothetical protein
MTKSPTPHAIAADLAVPERLLLFCLATNTDWQAASITHATAQHLLVRGLVERASGATSYRFTEDVRAVLAALMAEGT